MYFNYFRLNWDQIILINLTVYYLSNIGWRTFQNLDNIAKFLKRIIPVLAFFRQG
jgi:hypothetical protein